MLSLTMQKLGQQGAIVTRAGWKSELLVLSTKSSRWQSSESSAQKIRSLPWQYLRAIDECNYDPSTLQRIDVVVDLENGKPAPVDENTQEKHYIQGVSVDGENYTVSWSDGRCSSYTKPWINKVADNWKPEASTEGRVLWNGFTEEMVRQSPNMSIQFLDAITERGMSRSLQALYRYGIVLVTNTPIDDGGAGVAALGASLSGGTQKTVASTSLLKNYQIGGSEIMLPHGTEGPLRTLYGTVWSTSFDGQAEGASVADSAYGQTSLPLHTDMTYHRDPPGLQIFTMVQPAEEGGESVLGDGFTMAERLRSIDPKAFQTLSRTSRRFRCVDKETGWHLEASGCVIEVRNGRVVGIRHNDLDRLPDLPPFDLKDNVQATNEFYEELRRAHEQWNKLLSLDEFRLVMKLGPGDTVVVANQVRENKSIPPASTLLGVCTRLLIPLTNINHRSDAFMDGTAFVVLWLGQ
jgi:hypothetical protein